jgi:hypothetical protein
MNMKCNSLRYLCYVTQKNERRQLPHLGRRSWRPAAHRGSESAGEKRHRSTTREAVGGDAEADSVVEAAPVSIMYTY